MRHERLFPLAALARLQRHEKDVIHSQEYAPQAASKESLRGNASKVTDLDFDQLQAQLQQDDHATMEGAAVRMNRCAVSFDQAESWLGSLAKSTA